MWGVSMALTNLQLADAFAKRDIHVYGNLSNLMDACIAFWYAPSKGRRHTAVKCEGRLRAQIANMQIGFRGAEAVNTVLEVGEKGGCGYLRDPRINIGLVRKDDTVFRDYLQGVVHAP